MFRKKDVLTGHRTSWDDPDFQAEKSLQRLVEITHLSHWNHNNVFMKTNWSGNIDFLRH